MNMMKHLPTRPLGRDGPDVTVVCLGTWGLGAGMGAIEEKQAIRTVHAALDAGTNFIDTAEGYLTSESALGKALADRRDRVILATKLSGEHSRQHIRTAIENCQGDRWQLSEQDMAEIEEQIEGLSPGV